MRKITFLFVLASMLLLNACKKSESVSADKLKPGKSKISLSASGATSGSFSSDDLMSTVGKSSALINISASSVNLKTFTTEIVVLILSADITPGTYALKSMSSSNATPTFAYTKGSTGWAAAPAENDFTLVVTKATATEIEGTFSGKANNDSEHTEVTITNGKFAAKY